VALDAPSPGQRADQRDFWRRPDLLLGPRDRSGPKRTGFGICAEDSAQALIAGAAREHLSYWKAFVTAGGMIGDHTVSHPDLTKISRGQATAQWGQARTLLGRWLGQTPAVGRPPYGAFNHAVEVGAARGGLTALAGWSATMSGSRVQTWNGKPLSPGEIVLLHWDPGLGRQLTALLAAIRSQHLNPAPLTPASFAGIASQRNPLSGD